MKTFMTADGYLLFQADDATDGLWYDNTDPALVDVVFQSDANGVPVDHLGEPLSGAAEAGEFRLIIEDFLAF